VVNGKRYVKADYAYLSKLSAATILDIFFSPDWLKD